MAELPEAHICHLSSGRVRVRIPSMRKNAAYFSHLQEYLSSLPGVKRVEANPLTGGVLVFHCIDLKNVNALKPIADYSEMSGLFKIVFPETKPVSLAQNMADNFSSLNEKVKGVTDGTLDIPTVAFLALLGLSIVRLSQGVVGIPAITALWYASSILKDQLSKEEKMSRTEA